MTDWKNDPPTENQIRAILNMRRAFNDDSPLPKTKGEASLEIANLKAIIDNNISKTGMINPFASSAWHDDEEDWLDPIY